MFLAKCLLGPSVCLRPPPFGLVARAASAHVLGFGGVRKVHPQTQ